MFWTGKELINVTCLQSGIGNRRSIIALIYLFAAIVFVGSWVGYRKTPRHETLARLLFQLGMMAGLAVAILGYAMFNIFMAGAQDGAAVAVGYASISDKNVILVRGRQKAASIGVTNFPTVER